MENPGISAGDRKFLKKLTVLPASVAKVGFDLLEGVRTFYLGELRYHEKSRKFVETPDNFWVVIVQPRAESLRITVYGSRQQHGRTTMVQLKPDMGAYSAFVVNSPEQLPETLAIIRKAHRLKQGKVR